MNIEAETKVRLVMQAADAVKAEDVRVLDLRGISTFTDYFILASVFSQTQLRAAVREVRRLLKRAGEPPFKCDGEDSDRWVVMDLGDVVVHLFDPPTRSLYSLEQLWGDARTVDTAQFLTA